MIKSFLILVFSLMLTIVSAQDAKTYYEQGVELAKQNKPEEAIKLFDQSIALKSDEYVAWYNRGITKMMVRDYDGALTDLNQTILLKPDYKKAYLNRGTTRKHLTDYDGAMADYNWIIKRDTVNGETYYYRGMLSNLLGQRVSACLDFEKALKLGYKNAQEKMQRCVQRPTTDANIHSILSLSKVATDDSYGYSEAKPVKVGNGPEGGAANEHMYLDLLRDANGKPVKYTRIGTCCPYESKHALMGKYATEDKYELTYINEKNTEKKATVYMSLYDYEEPMIPAGLKTLAHK